ncbi:CopD family protein [Croceicoccus ponticola]|uniref:Protoporphyrinogen IX oxidase n=1 Tax=Croceicoccus ponticola TaxID=2217664 RepID=A0A437GYI4_9SPHN|nr:CopD family protein [Croceicoccus ponticola]RVQ67706.1 CopD family protein [Croceicoccus ponticola]
MQEVLALLYPWLKVGHLVFVIFWMAGLFMLPRFFVYHQEALAGSEEATRWVERESRLRKIILNPAIVMVWVFGLALAFTADAWGQGWFHLKLLFVLSLSGYHGWMSVYAKRLARGEPTLTGKQLRLLNEVPGIAAILIVTTVVIGRFYLT